MRAVAIGASGCAGTIARDVRRKSEGEIAKFDFAGDRCVGSDGDVAVVDLRLRAKDVIEAAHGSGAALENVGDPAEGDHGPHQEVEIRKEREEGADGELVAQDLMAALPEKDEKRSA